MTVPTALAEAMDALPEDPRFELAGGWTDRGEGAWSFLFRARLSEPATEHVAEWTAWHLVLLGGRSDPEIRIHPDADEGIIASFPHQDHNGEPVGERPWRTGKPCLERPVAVFRRSGWSAEPAELPDRLAWRIGRLLDWIDAAAAGRLLAPGDPLELPAYPTIDTRTVLGFRETVEDLHWWSEHEATWGFATISQLPGARDTAVVSDFMDPTRRSIRRVPWSEAVPINEGRVDAVWMLLPSLVVFAPWRAATTWAELVRLVSNVGIDLPGILADAGARLRRIRRPRSAEPVHLLIGFPLEARVGGDPERFDWIAVRNIQLCRREDVRKGYSDRTGARRAWDRKLADSPRRLKWRRTANWAPDQLRKRGRPRRRSVRSRCW